MLINISGFKQYKSGLASYHDKGLRLYYVYGRMYMLTGFKPVELDLKDTYKLILRSELFN